MRRILVIALLTLVAFGCTSRYRMDFFVTENGKRNKAKVIERQFITGSRLNDPYADEKIVLGEGNTVQVTLNFRGQRHAAEYGTVLGYDENLRYRLYVHLDGPPGPQSVQLLDNSFLILAGRYDMPSDVKIYLPSSGQMVIDSLHKDDMFATIAGEYANIKGERVSVNGRLRVRVKR